MIVKKKLRKLRDNIELLLSASGNDLKFFAELNIKKYEKEFNSDFLQDLSCRANELLLAKHTYDDILGIKDSLNSKKKEDCEYEFPIPGLDIGMN